MKKMAAGAFKANCLAVMDEVQAKRVTVVITKRGKPVVNIYDFFKGKGFITGDVVSPVLSLEEWGDLA